MVNIKIILFLSAHINSFLNNYLFLKFINKCQNEILRCAPPSSHMCDIFQNLSLMYICNLRWRHSRFRTLRRCCRGIFNFLTLKIWEIDLLGTCYIYTDLETCSIVELQNQKFSSLFFWHQCCKQHLKLLQKQISITLLWLKLKIGKLDFLS